MLDSNLSHTAKIVGNDMPNNPLDVSTQMKNIIQNKLTDDEIESFLTSLNAKGITAHDLTAAANCLLKHAIQFDTSCKIRVDCVGTGGDNLNTYNISTLSSLVLASLSVPVTKHGNRKVSSTCGSADLLSLLNIDSQLTPSQAQKSLERHYFCFLAAPLYHSGVKHAANARKSLSCKTIFNLLGPLINPAKPTHSLIGVANPTQLRLVAQAAHALGIQHAMIVHGGGMDEIAIHESTQGYLIKDGHLSSFEINPQHLGIPHYPLKDLVSTCPQKNKHAALDCLMGHGLGALKSAVALNAGSLLFLCGKAHTMKHGYEIVFDHLSTDKAYLHCQELKTHAQ